MSYKASTVMNASAALLNDSVLVLYSYDVQLPYLNIAMQRLQEIFQENNIPVTNEVSIPILIPAGVTEVPVDPGVILIVSDPPVLPEPGPYYPDDLVEIQGIWEQWEGEQNKYVPMERKEFLPLYEPQTTNLIWWTFNNQIIRFIGATNDVQIKLQYIKNIFSELTASDDTIEVLNVQTHLEFATAALLAEFVQQNPERAAVLESRAAEALERGLNISNKGRQSISIRRKPFRASWKSQGTY